MSYNYGLRPGVTQKLTTKNSSQASTEFTAETNYNS